MLPPNMSILVRGTASVLTLTTAVSGSVGLAAMDAMTALNATGFTGVCALAPAAIFHALALERIGFAAARRAAIAVVRVLGGSAAAGTVLLLVLLREDRFREEASRFGLHSVAGMAVLVVLAALLVLLWRDR